VADGPANGQTFMDGQAVSNLTTDNNAYVTMMAQWQAHTWGIRFEGGPGSSGAMPDMACLFETPTNLTANAFTKTGYLFDCWTNSVGTEFTDRCAIPAGGNFVSTNETAVLYAKWTMCDYNIHYLSGKQGSGWMMSELRTYDEPPFQLAPYGFTPEAGYSFSHWSDGSRTFLDQQWVSNLTAVPGGTVNLEAMYTGVVYTVSLYTNALHHMMDFNASYGSPYGFMPTPRYEGHAFDGWWLGGQRIGFMTNVATVGNHNLVAHWKPAPPMQAIQGVDGVGNVLTNVTVDANGVLNLSDLPAWVLDIDTSVTRGNDAIETVYLGTDVVELLMAYNENLSDVVFDLQGTGDDIHIGFGAFAWCLSLETLSFPPNDLYIGNLAFKGCINLSDIYFEGDAPKDVGYEVFKGTGGGDYGNLMIYYYADPADTPKIDEFELMFGPSEWDRLRGDNGSITLTNMFYFRP